VSEVTTWKQYFLTHGSLFTSIASVSIALMAFGLTIYNARLDRQYKELSIRPALHIDVETSDFHVGIVNMGLGPAEIISIATKFEPDRCLIFFRRPALPSDDAEKLADKTFGVMPPINAYFADPLAELLQSDSVWDPPVAPRMYARTLTPGEILPSGKEVILFEIQKETIEIMQKKLQSMKGPDYNKIMRRLIVRAQAIPYYVHYCSITGEYCVNQIEEHCG
jgi:hypothetical protein